MGDLLRMVMVSIYYSSIIPKKETHQTDKVIFHSFMTHDLKGVLKYIGVKIWTHNPAHPHGRDRHF